MPAFQILKSYLVHSIGWSTNRKVILFLSDDWGGIRVPSIKAREALHASGIDMKDNRFDLNDTLESNSDLEGLFEILLNHKDGIGNHPVITAVTNVANPDFTRIRDSGYRNYYYEPFNETLCRYPDHDRVFNLYIKGIELNIFRPEFHGREHLQINWWLENLQTGNEMVRKAFEQEYWYLTAKYLHNPIHRSLAAAFDIADHDEVKFHQEVLSDGIGLFRRLFGYQPVLCVPPSQHYNSDLEPTLSREGIKLIDVPLYRKMPLGNGRSSIKFHYLGQKNQLGLRYLVRNSVFEPNLSKISDGVNECMTAIDLAFKFKKPAIISNHRAAFVGGLDTQNRKQGLIALDSLLKSISKRWPDAEFLSASSFSRLMDNK